MYRLQPKGYTKHEQEDIIVKCVTKTAEHAIKGSAERKQENVMLGDILGVDLIAKEACYHSACRKIYTRMATRNKKGVDTQTAKSVHKIMLEALERLLMQKFEASQGDILTAHVKAKLNDLVNSPSKEKLDDVKETPECQIKFANVN